jgi:hypothetical protein
LFLDQLLSDEFVCQISTQQAANRVLVTLWVAPSFMLQYVFHQLDFVSVLVKYCSRLPDLVLSVLQSPMHGVAKAYGRTKL